MNKENEREYFQRRAEEELVLAQDGALPAVVAAHYKLAENYLERVDSGAAAIPSEREDLASETGRGAMNRGSEQPGARPFPRRLSNSESAS